MADCSEISLVLNDIALNLGSRAEFKTIDSVVKQMKKDLPQIDRQTVVDAIVAANQSKPRKTQSLERQLQQLLKTEARTDKRLRTKILAMQQHLREGTLPEKAPRKVTKPTKTIKLLRGVQSELQRKLRKSEPAQRERIQKQIKTLTERIEEGDIALPKKRIEAPASKALERLQFERDKLRFVINEQIRNLKPKTIWEKIAEPFNAARALKTAFDFSALLRQGGAIVIANPFRAFKPLVGATKSEKITTTPFVEMFRAFGSEKVAAKAAAEIDTRPNAPLYARSKLQFTEVGGKLTNLEEIFQTNFFERLSRKGKLGRIAAEPVLASNRAFVTVLNRLRADSFDTMLATLTKSGDATLAEATAIANWVNVATGRGSLGKGKFGMERAATALNTAFFAPKLVASRFQILTGQPILGKKGATLRTKRLIAKEYAKFAIGLGTIWALASLRDDVKDIEFDPRSSDFGKIVIGNTRIDLMAGLSQVIVALARIAKGEIKPLSTGKIKEISELEVAGRFARTKLSPAFGTPIDLKLGVNVVGEPVTPGSAAVNLITPIAPEDVLDAMREQGIPKGTALGLMALLGVGIQTFEIRKQKKRKRQRRTR